MSRLQDLHILVAEDDPTDTYLIIQSLKRQGVYSRISHVKDGEELLDFLKNNPDELPDIILTDINMPKINGIEALEEISKDDTLRKIPVFICSSTLNPLYEKRSKEFGAMGYLIKPLKINGFDELFANMLRTLDKHSKKGME